MKANMIIKVVKLDPLVISIGTGGFGSISEIWKATTRNFKASANYFLMLPKFQV